MGRLAGCSPWGHKESDMTERLKLAIHKHESSPGIHVSPLGVGVLNSPPTSLPAISLWVVLEHWL